MNRKTYNLMRFGYLSLMVIWVIVQAFNCVSQGWHKNLTLYHFDNQVGVSDFVHFYVAGKVTLDSQRSQLYSWEVQKHFLDNLTSLQLPKEDFMTQYSPIVFLMMAPFALLPVDYAHLLFDIVNVFVGLFGCFMLSRYFIDGRNNMVVWTFLGALASFPSWLAWVNGQMSWFYVGIACCYLAFLMAEKNVLAALCLAITFVKPQYSLFLLIPALSLKRFLPLFYTGGWGLLFFILCSSIFGLKAMISYPQVLNQTELSVHTGAMYCMRPVLELFMPDKIAYYCSVFLLFVVLACLIIIGLMQVKKNPEVFRWLLCVCVLAATLFSPHTHAHDLILLIIPALLTLPFAERDGRRINVLIWRAIFCLMPIISWGCYALVCSNLHGSFVLTGIIALLFICGLKQIFRHKTA